MFLGSAAAKNTQSNLPFDMELIRKLFVVVVCRCGAPAGNHIPCGFRINMYEFSEMITWSASVFPVKLVNNGYCTDFPAKCHVIFVIKPSVWNAHGP